ncbi:hypothetical protein Pfo_006853 [Paulownia fortunei]|nr:hypothetical protein Pfo_006853 [Paulownia fortunei]
MKIKSNFKEDELFFHCIPEKSPKYVDKHGRRFLPSWFKLFPDWLEYSPSKNIAYYLPCYLFVKPSTHYGANAFTTDGFQTWKKHIENIIDKQSTELVAKNRLRLKVLIDVARLCAFQCIAFRAHNECLDSHNRSNFLEIMKHTASYNDEVRSIILENAPQNVSYTFPQIQKEILSLYASRIQRFIREEIGDAKYYLIVDESRDKSKREQMAIVLRFVDKECFIWEKFFDVVHIEDTKASTLKREISSIISHNNLIIQNIRGQGYDSASTMREEWNGLQALFLNECPYAYYCYTYRAFFSYLAVIVNLVNSFSKRHDQLHIANAVQIVKLTSTNELETGKEKNQIGTIQCLGDTRWGSHLRSLLILLDMFDPILLVLSEIINDKSSLSTKPSVDGAYDIMTLFEFVFILHFIVELLEMTDDLCRILQYKSQDILNAMDAIANIKELVDFIRVILLPWSIIINIFTGTIDSILLEMSYRFDKNAVELLKLNSALDSRDGYKSFNINDICKLVEKFYPSDYTSQEKLHIKYQLELFELDIRRNIHFKNVSTLSELCQILLIKLILTLPVSTATTERAFSSMKFVKTRLRNKMEDDFLASS